MFVMSWQTLNTVEATSAQPADSRSARSPRQFLWTFDYLPADYQPGKDVKPLYTRDDARGRRRKRRPRPPAGRTVHLYLESPDVIHAFYVPQFLFKRDVVPGAINSFEFTLNESDAGNTFHGQCAELCGVEPQRDALRRPRHDRRRLRRLAGGQHRAGQRLAAATAVG